MRAHDDVITEALRFRSRSQIVSDGLMVLDELTSEHSTRHRTSASEFEVVREYALLDQLQGALPVGRSMSGGAASGGHAPVAINALDLWQQIGQVAGQELRALGGAGGQHPSFAVRAWWALAQSRGDEVVWCEYWLSRWAGRIRALLDPPSRREIPKPCPECRASWVLAEDLTTGQRIRQRALLLEGDWIVCRNRACLSAWQSSQWIALAKRLGTYALKEAA